MPPPPSPAPVAPACTRSLTLPSTLEAWVSYALPSCSVAASTLGAMFISSPRHRYKAASSLTRRLNAVEAQPCPTRYEPGRGACFQRDLSLEVRHVRIPALEVRRSSCRARLPASHQRRLARASHATGGALERQPPGRHPAGQTLRGPERPFKREYTAEDVAIPELKNTRTNIATARLHSHLAAGGTARFGAIRAAAHYEITHRAECREAGCGVGFARALSWGCGYRKRSDCHQFASTIC